MSRHPQHDPPPGYFVDREPSPAGPWDEKWDHARGWCVYLRHENLPLVAGPYTRRYNAVAAAWRAYNREAVRALPVEGVIPWIEKEQPSV